MHTHIVRTQFVKCSIVEVVVCIVVVVVAAAVVVVVVCTIDGTL